MIWKNDKIRLDYYLRVVSDANDPEDYTKGKTSVIITHIWAPAKLKSKSDEIISMITETVNVGSDVTYATNYQGVVVSDGEPIFVESMENYL